MKPDAMFFALKKAPRWPNYPEGAHFRELDSAGVGQNGDVDPTSGIWRLKTDACPIVSSQPS